MKYRRLGKSGPQVSTASAGRGSQSGTNRMRNLEQNVATVELEIAAGDLQHLSEVFAVGAGAGARYREHVMKGLDL